MKKRKLVALFIAIFIAGQSIIVLAGELGIFPHQRTNSPYKANATVGKYLYVGTAPRFEADELFMVSSKVGLTLRVTASVSDSLRNRYAQILFERFYKIYQAFSIDSKKDFIPLQTYKKLESRAKDSSTRLWLKIAEPYSKHVLENHGVDFNEVNASSVISSNKEKVLTALLRYYFNNDALELSSVESLKSSLSDSSFLINLSQQLFDFHLGKIFTRKEHQNTAKTKSFIGTLTYVYPIAATAEGPFDQPSEGVRDFGLSGNIESRIWSEKWDDQFGGFPFLLVEWSGVAFHGPITNFEPLDIWFLRRGFVSHGCHRMDSSDILELRELTPKDLSNLESERKPITHVTLTWPDVTDWNNDGQDEVVDVNYYEIPTWVPVVKKGESMDVLAAAWMGEKAKKSWRKEHYTAYNYSIDAEKKPFYDPATEKYTSLPNYQVVGKKLIRNGYHAELPIYTFQASPNRILQFEDGQGLPKSFDDNQNNFGPNKL